MVINKFATGVIVSLLLVSSNTQAVIVSGQMTGLISDAAETRGIGSSVFGLDGLSLMGQPFYVDFTYDIAVAPIISMYTGTNESIKEYESNSPLINWLNMSITVNNITHALNGQYQHAEIFDYRVNTQGTPDDYFKLEVINDQGFIGNQFRRQGINMAFSMQKSVLSTATLPVGIDWDLFTSGPYSSGFFINDFDHDQSNNITYQRYVNFTMDVQQVNASVIPIPPSFILFSTSIAGLLLIGLRNNGTNKNR